MLWVKQNIEVIKLLRHFENIFIQDKDFNFRAQLDELAFAYLSLDKDDKLLFKQLINIVLDDLECEKI